MKRDQKNEKNSLIENCIKQWKEMSDLGRIGVILLLLWVIGETIAILT